MSAFIDLDLTLTEERTITAIEKALGLDRKIEEVLSLQIVEEEKSRKIASILSGVSIEKFREASSKTKVAPCSRELILELSSRSFEIYVVTLSYRQAAEAVLRKIIDEKRNVKILSPELEVYYGRITGKVFGNSKIRETPWCIRCPLCKRDAIFSHRKHPSIAIGDSIPDVCMFLEADFSILIDRGSVPEGLKRFASVSVPNLCEALEVLKSYLNRGVA